MVDKGNTDKHRTGIEGSGLGRITETSKWGADTARQRYGKLDSGGMKPKDASQPQFKSDQHGPGYTNDVASGGWMRGGDATKYPGFIPGGGKAKRG